MPDGEVISLDCKCGKKEPMRVVILDQEHSFDPTWVKRFNVRTEDLLVIETEFAEQAIDVVDNCIRSQQCDLLIVDSIAALTPMIEIQESSEKWQMGVMARLLGKAFRKWTSGMNSYGLNADTKCTILMVNQLRLAIGGYKPTVTSPGGKAADFYQSLEIRLKKIQNMINKGSGRPIGVEVEFNIKKNKTFPITGDGQFCLYFVAEQGKHSVGDTDTDVQVSRLGAYWGIIKKEGSWFYFPDGSKAYGAKKAGAMLKENPKLMTHVMDLIKEKELAWQETGVTLDGPQRESDDSEESDESEETVSEDVDG
jgi:recombination protein RecA